MIFHLGVNRSTVHEVIESNERVTDVTDLSFLSFAENALDQRSLFRENLFFEDFLHSLIIERIDH